MNAPDYLEAGPSESPTYIPLGHGLLGEPISLGKVVHTLVIGERHSSASLLMPTIAVGALLEAHQVVLIDPIQGGEEYSRYGEWLASLATTSTDTVSVLRSVASDVDRRAQFLFMQNVSHWQDLDTDLLPLTREMYEPLTIIWPDFVPLSDDELRTIHAARSSGHRAIDSDLRLRARAQTYLIFLGSYGAEVNIYFVIGCTPESVSALPSTLLASMRTHVTVLSNYETSAPEIQSLFATDGSKASRRGLSLIQVDEGPVKGFQMDFFRSADIPRVLAEADLPTYVAGATD